MSRFYGAHNTYTTTLDKTHSELILGFKSTNQDQNEFLINDSFGYAKLNLGVTYLLFNSVNDRLVSFITLAMGTIKLPEDWSIRGKLLREYPKDFPQQLPALRIGQLATQANEENKGAGAYLLSFAVRKAIELQAIVGCAYLVIDANPDKVTWYEKNGFKVLRRGEKTVCMYFEL